MQVSAERLGLQIAQDCEVEQRELDTFVGSMLQGLNETPRNPLRPEVIGNAMIRSVDQVTDRAELRKVLVAELGRSLATSMAEHLCGDRQGPACRRSETGSMSVRRATHDSGFVRTGSGSGFDTTSRPVGLDDSRSQGLDTGSGHGDLRSSRWQGDGPHPTGQGRFGASTRQGSFGPGGARGRRCRVRRWARSTPG